MRDKCVSGVQPSHNPSGRRLGDMGVAPPPCVKIVRAAARSDTVDEATGSDTLLVADSM
jgi:hypothetical protein